MRAIGMQTLFGNRGWSAVVAAIVIAGSLGVTSGKAAVTNAEGIVQQVAANELKVVNLPGRYMYELRRETPRGSETKLMIETKDWLIGRLIEINDRPLTAQQRKKEDGRLALLLSDNDALRKEEAKLRDDERIARELIKALPEAFVYDHKNFEKNSVGDQEELLAFEPNPVFEPSTRELTVLTGMKGTMVINTAAMRLVRVECTLFRSVNFGWGILARLDPGGSVVLEQESLGNGRWVVRKLDLHLTGKFLLFKSLRIDSVLTTRNFRRIPDDLTVIQGLQLLKKQDEETTNQISEHEN